MNQIIESLRSAVDGYFNRHEDRLQPRFKRACMFSAQPPKKAERPLRWIFPVRFVATEHQVQGWLWTWEREAHGMALRVWEHYVDERRAWLPFGHGNQPRPWATWVSHGIYHVPRARYMTAKLLSRALLRDRVSTPRAVAREVTK